MSRTHESPIQSPATSDGAWKVDTPFGPPEFPRSFPGGIRRLRNTLSKLSPAAMAEKEILRKKESI
ncbi:hypothetical protein N7494_002712 [Penicillium frequentans]|uniref:Uncharacterized protein n=1 Tax=Penicillium frequentans TaxID=3151616 RepID=A0AAD6D4F9_9EURO|nr:hypothetical protein N7494_002712 [Penicillium glabrum]